MSSINNKMGALFSAGGTGQTSGEGFPIFKNRFREANLLGSTFQPDGSPSLPTLDASGWPNDPAGFFVQLWLSDTGSIAQIPWCQATGPSGAGFSCGFRGSGSENVSCDPSSATITNLHQSTITGITTFTFTVTANNTIGFIVDTVSQSVTDIFAYLPEYNDLTSIDDPLDASAYTTEAIAHYGQYSHIRFMDWNNVIPNCQIATAAHRSVYNPLWDGGANTNTQFVKNNGGLTGYFCDGVPQEWVFAFCKACGIDCWMNFPSTFDPTFSYVTSVANSLAALGGIPSGMNVYVEIGDELWNDEGPGPASWESLQRSGDTVGSPLIGYDCTISGNVLTVGSTPQGPDPPNPPPQFNPFLIGSVVTPSGLTITAQTGFNSPQGATGYHPGFAGVYTLSGTDTVSSTTISVDSTVYLTGSISAGVLTVTAIDNAYVADSPVFLAPGMYLSGAGVTNVLILSQATNTDTHLGGLGTYHVTPTDVTVGSEAMSALWYPHYLLAYQAHGVATAFTAVLGDVYGTQIRYVLPWQPGNPNVATLADVFGAYEAMAASPANWNPSDDIYHVCVACYINLFGAFTDSVDGILANLVQQCSIANANFTVSSVSGSTGQMVVNGVSIGPILPGMYVMGTIGGFNFPDVRITSQASGTTGGIGTYNTNYNTTSTSPPDIGAATFFGAGSIWGNSCEQIACMGLRWGLSLVSYEGAWQTNGEIYRDDPNVGLAVMDPGMQAVMDTFYQLMLNVGYTRFSTTSSGVNSGIGYQTSGGFGSCAPINNLDYNYANLLTVPSGSPRFLALQDFFPSSNVSTRNVIAPSGTTVIPGGNYLDTENGIIANLGNPGQPPWDAPNNAGNGGGGAVQNFVSWLVYYNQADAGTFTLSANFGNTSGVEAVYSPGCECNGAQAERVYLDFIVPIGTNDVEIGSITLQPGANYVCLGWYNNPQPDVTVNSLSFEAMFGSISGSTAAAFTASATPSAPTQALAGTASMQFEASATAEQINPPQTVEIYSYPTEIYYHPYTIYGRSGISGTASMQFEAEGTLGTPGGLLGVASMNFTAEANPFPFDYIEGVASINLTAYAKISGEPLVGTPGWVATWPVRQVFPNKLPQESVVALFDFTAALIPGMLITSAVNSISVIYGSDPEPTSVFNGAPWVDPTGHYVLLPLTGGIDLTTYLINIQCSTNFGPLVLELQAILPVSY